MQTPSRSEQWVARLARSSLWCVFVVISTLLCLGIYAWYFEPSLVHLIRLLAKWQTLIAGALAVAAAIVGGLFVQAQIDTNLRLEREHVNRRFRTARATLPLTLSSLIDHAERCAGILEEHRQHFGKTNLPFTASEFPPIPGDVVTGMREVIEFGAENVSKPAAVIISSLQISSARLKGFCGKWKRASDFLPVEANFTEYAVDIAEIHALASKLFDFARGRGPVPSSNLQVEEIEQSLRLLFINYGILPFVDKVIARKAEFSAKVFAE